LGVLVNVKLGEWEVWVCTVLHAVEAVATVALDRATQGKANLSCDGLLGVNSSNSKLRGKSSSSGEWGGDNSDVRSGRLVDLLALNIRLAVDHSEPLL
jgi:hypothetical protein